MINNMDILAHLNPDQKKAAGFLHGPAIVLSGPGSGKTRVITHRIAYLIKNYKIDPRKILAVTDLNRQHDSFWILPAGILFRRKL